MSAPKAVLPPSVIYGHFGLQSRFHILTLIRQIRVRKHDYNFVVLTYPPPHSISLRIRRSHCCCGWCATNNVFGEKHELRDYIQILLFSCDKLLKKSRHRWKDFSGWKCFCCEIFPSIWFSIVFATFSSLIRRAEKCIFACAEQWMISRFFCDRWEKFSRRAGVGNENNRNLYIYDLIISLTETLDSHFALRQS